MVFNMIYDNFGGSQSTVKEKIKNLISWLEEKGINFKELTIALSATDLEKLKNIEVDKNIRESKKEEFLKIMKKIEAAEDLSKNDIVKIFTFINDVRNNFFHGTKVGCVALDTEQEERFAVYLNFLEKLADKFVEIVKDKR